MQFPPEPEGRRCQTDMPKEDVARGVGDQTNTTAVRERSVSQHSARSRSEDRAMDALRRLGRRAREKQTLGVLSLRGYARRCAKTVGVSYPVTRKSKAGSFVFDGSQFPPMWSAITVSVTA